MRPQELYELLDRLEVDYEVVEIFEGVRYIRVEVEEVNPTEGEEK
jgi:glutaredoxin-related protein